MTEHIVDDEQEVIDAEADSIALKLTSFLVDGFKKKEGRDPEPAEIEQLMGELTEERIAELLGEELLAGGGGDAADEGSDVEESDVDPEEESKEVHDVGTAEINATSAESSYASTIETESSSLLQKRPNNDAENATADEQQPQKKTRDESDGTTTLQPPETA